MLYVSFDRCENILPIKFQGELLLNLNSVYIFHEVVVVKHNQTTLTKII